MKQKLLCGHCAGLGRLSLRMSGTLGHGVVDGMRCPKCKGSGKVTVTMQDLAGRRGKVFSVRVTDEQRARIEQRMSAGGPRALGPWLLWSALGGDRAGSTPKRPAEVLVVPTRAPPAR